MSQAYSLIPWIRNIDDLMDDNLNLSFKYTFFMWNVNMPSQYDNTQKNFHKILSQISTFCIFPCKGSNK